MNVSKYPLYIRYKIEIFKRFLINSQNLLRIYFSILLKSISYPISSLPIYAYFIYNL